MSLNVKPAGANSDQPQGPAKYVPTRQAAGMTGNTAPIPGANEVRIRGAEQAAPPPPADEDAGSEEQGAEPESWRLAKLAQKDRWARQRLEAAKAAEARAQERERALAEREQALKAGEEKQARWRRDPKALLADHGYVPEAALQYMLQGEKLTPEQEMALKIEERIEKVTESVEQRLARERQEREDADRQREADEAEANRRAAAEQERVAVEELHNDIDAVIDADPRSFVLLSKAEKKEKGRGLAIVYGRVQQLAEEQFQKTGRYPPISTKLIERAAQEVEEQARAEYRETLQDPELLAAVDLRPRAAPPPPRTLTNRGPTATREQPSAQEHETPQQKRQRFISWLDAQRRAGR